MENIFVYGTLMKDTNHPMSNLIRQKSRFIGDALLKGKLFLVDYYPGAVASNNGNDLVKGEVYALKDVAQVLEALDEYEEYDPSHEKDSEFIRRKLDVTLENGTKLTAWVYLYNFPTNGLNRIPSGDFRNYLQEKTASSVA
jgi:gamma-glutamylcyclotransferase (GGCT)/AIG2-like uncharacterized protein YtfP